MTDFIYPKALEHREGAERRVCGYLRSLQIGKEYRVSISLVRATRTNLQNAYLFGVAYPLIAEHTGYLVDDIHQELCCRFFGRKTIRVPRSPSNEIGVRDVPVRTTTRDEHGGHDVLTWDVFWQFVESVQGLGDELGVVIPDPDPVLRRHRTKKPA